MALAVSGIPQIAAGTVPLVAKQLFEIAASGPIRIGQLAMIVTDAGSHSNYVATIEGSYDGVTFFNLANAALNPTLPAGVTLTENGIVLPSNAVALVGLVLNFGSLNFLKYRLGLAGDNVAADGAGLLVIKPAP